jgi:hypothetical protein
MLSKNNKSRHKKDTRISKFLAHVDKAYKDTLDGKFNGSALSLLQELLRTPSGLQFIDHLKTENEKSQIHQMELERVILLEQEGARTWIYKQILAERLERIWPIPKAPSAYSPDQDLGCIDI